MGERVGRRRRIVARRRRTCGCRLTTCGTLTRSWILLSISRRRTRRYVPTRRLAPWSQLVDRGVSRRFCLGFRRHPSSRSSRTRLLVEPLLTSLSSDKRCVLRPSTSLFSRSLLILIFNRRRKSRNASSTPSNRRSDARRTPAVPRTAIQIVTTVTASVIRSTVMARV